MIGGIRPAPSLAIALSIGLAALVAIWRPAPLPAMDWLVYDALTRADTTTARPTTTAVVAIDEASLARLGQWPWPRDVVAELVDRLSTLGATVVAFDVLFAEPERLDAAGDARLAAAFARVPVVVGHGFTFEAPAPPTGCELHPADLAERQRGDQPPRAGLFEATGAICALPALASAAGASGFINVTPDPDGLLRRMPLLLRYRDRVYPALPLAAAHRMTGGGALVLDARADGYLALTVGGRTVGTDERGRLLVRTGATPADRDVIPAIDVLEGRVATQRVQGRAVFVGATALGLRDVVSTAADRDVPGVFVHAAVADTLLGGPGFERPELAPLIEVGAAVTAALVIAVTGARYGLTAALLVATLVAGVAGWSARRWLIEDGRFLSPFWVWVAGGTSLAVHGLTSLWRERRRADRERQRRGDAQRLIIQALTTLTETRDVDTGRHARRTQELTRILATALARTPAYRATLDDERIALISTLAPLHDIGKVGVSDAVLRKPGQLTPTEHEEMRRHPGMGYDSLLRAEALAGVHDDEVLQVAKDIVYTHHERWDGSGYPRGLQGQAIPVSGRIVALVDAYDALVTTRAYRQGVSHEAAVEAVVSGRGTHFDPDLVDAFLTVQEQFAAAALASPGE